ncbi:MAG: hypothetical protein ABEI78_02435 [Candidatus Nanohaloarchaea archaeon]
MLTMDLIRRIKNWLFEKQRDETPALPKKFFASRFMDVAEKSGLSGKRVKIIKEIENGEERTRHLPYQPEIAEAMKEEQRMPHFPEHGGAESPEHDTLDEYDPGKIKWDA